VKRLSLEAFQIRRDIARAVERHDVHSNLGHHRPFKAPMKALPYAAACFGLTIIRSIMPAAIDARTAAAPNWLKCLVAYRS
jgi:hypothetical protein